MGLATDRPQARAHRQKTLPSSLATKPDRPRTGIVGENRGHLGGWIGFNGLMLLPALFLMGVFLYYPAVAAFKVTMESWTGFSPTAKFIGLKNFIQMLGDENFGPAMKNSIVWMFVGGVGHFLFAFILAVGLQDPQLRARKFFQTLIVFPMFISAIGVAMLWSQLFDPTRGMINLIGSLFGLTDPANASPGWLDSNNGIYPLLLVSIWGGVGGQVILLLAGLRQIPTQLYEAARVDGATESQCFWRISLPLMRDVVVIAVVLWIIGSLQVFGLVQGMLGPEVHPRQQVVSTYIFQMAFNNRSNIYMMGQATAMAVSLVLLTLVIVLTLIGAYRVVFGRERLEY